MLHCSHEHDRTNATGALQLCDKQPNCDVCRMRHDVSGENHSRDAAKNRCRFYVFFYAMVWMIPPSARNAAPLVTDASREET